MAEQTDGSDRSLPVAAAGVVLAGGSSRRYGATKQLALLDGRPLVRHVTDLLHAADLEHIIVVTGHDAAAVEAATGPDVLCIRNREHHRGQSTSVRAGLEAVDRIVPAVDVVVIVLADQPQVPSEVVRRVVEDARRSDRPTRARYTDVAAPPVALPRSCWNDVRQLLVGDAGARGFLAALGVKDVHVGRPMPPDVDSVSDLHALEERNRSGPTTSRWHAESGIR